MTSDGTGGIVRAVSDYQQLNANTTAIAGAVPGAALPLLQQPTTMNLASLQRHLQLPQHQAMGGMQFMAYHHPTVMGMPATTMPPMNHHHQSLLPLQYSFVHQAQAHQAQAHVNVPVPVLSHQQQNHNLNMSLHQAGQMLGPNVAFQIPTGLTINAHHHQEAQAASDAMYHSGVVPSVGMSGMVIPAATATHHTYQALYTDPRAAAAAAVQKQRTTTTTNPQVVVGAAAAPYINSSSDVFGNVTPTLTTPPPPQKTTTRPAFAVPQQRPNRRNYRDYATDADEPHDEPGVIVSGKDHSFPVKLHRILSDPEFQEYICWMPHGRSWKVLQQDDFEDKVIPLFFRHGKFSSFMRQVNGWGFRRMPAGNEKNSYYQEMFLRGFPYLSAKMRRPVEKIRSTSDLKAHPNFNDSKLFVALPKELHQQFLMANTSNNNNAADSINATDSNNSPDSNGSGSGRTSGFDTDTTTNDTNDGSGSDQGSSGGVNLSNLYGGRSDSASPDRFHHLYGSSNNSSSGGSEQGGNLYGGSDQGSAMYGFSGSDQGSNHYGSENGSSSNNNGPNGLFDANNDSNSCSDGGTGSDNGGTTSDGSSSIHRNNPCHRSRSSNHHNKATAESSAATNISAGHYHHQQLVYRQLAREAQLNTTRSNIMPSRP
eukprot:CAMPEP_0119011992 /NCGR_PEP_ID=MMETSP1176-20130426/6009_1 /TAXON_ID=265551 /ORGANISM="Synedropsis recta cf, Strain CCMP1620" /LENGTH=651 /DNA_ID=CAMNT_0006964883 /DNA_START=50 /DNA_END=2005 /DNA_ORIENTATION=-